jgi:hypothetical protein
MRCTSCGLPLSPARTMTSCPRCGTPIVSDKKSSSSPAQQSFPQTVTWKPVASTGAINQAHTEVERGPMGRSGGVGSGSDSFHPAGAHVQSPVTFPSTSPTAPAYLPQPTSQPDSLLPSTSVGTRFIAPGNKGHNVQQPQIHEYGEASLGSLRSDAKEQESARVLTGSLGDFFDAPQAGAKELIGAPQSPLRAPAASTALTSQHQPWQPRDPIRRHARRGNNNLGFIVAGVCVIMGGLLLVFIYFMAMGLSGSSTGRSTVKTNIATNSSPTTASSPVSSPTATPFPGQKYIDHPQLASRIDPTSRQAIQLTTTFKSNQNIYIAFQLHPAGQNGVVCLSWYANNKQFATYQLPVYASEQSSYAYATYRGTGSGYVELYWASTTKCTDKVLAQRVNFTVTT